jgi:hypothetical protein
VTRDDGGFATVCNQNNFFEFFVLLTPTAAMGEMQK